MSYRHYGAEGSKQFYTNCDNETENNNETGTENNDITKKTDNEKLWIYRSLVHEHYKKIPKLDKKTSDMLLKGVGWDEVMANEFNYKNGEIIVNNYENNSNTQEIHTTPTPNVNNIENDAISIDSQDLYNDHNSNDDASTGDLSEFQQKLESELNDILTTKNSSLVRKYSQNEFNDENYDNAHRVTTPTDEDDKIVTNLINDNENNDDAMMYRVHTPTIDDELLKIWNRMNLEDNNTNIIRQKIPINSYVSNFMASAVQPDMILNGQHILNQYLGTLSIDRPIVSIDNNTRFQEHKKISCDKLINSLKIYCIKNNMEFKIKSNNEVAEFIKKYINKDFKYIFLNVKNKDIFDKKSNLYFYYGDDAIELYNSLKESSKDTLLYYLEDDNVYEY